MQQSVFGEQGDDLIGTTNTRMGASMHRLESQIFAEYFDAA
jgi:hypothetical protein